MPIKTDELCKQCKYSTKHDCYVNKGCYGCNMKDRKTGRCICLTIKEGANCNRFIPYDQNMKGEKEMKNNLFVDNCGDTLDLSKMASAIGTFDPYKISYDPSLTSIHIGAGPASEPKKPEEWIWVVGYKGTNSDMSCRDVKYEIGKQFDMPEDSEIEACRNGYHLCMNLRDVFGYYEIGKGHRFFEVKALVRKSDIANYPAYTQRPYTGNSNMSLWSVDSRKLAAKSIEFVRECTLDEIFKDTIAADWDEKYKKMALTSGIGETESMIQVEELTQYGYSLPFADYIIQQGRYEQAKAVGSQSDLSMDMKALWILKM